MVGTLHPPREEAQATATPVIPSTGETQAGSPKLEANLSSLERPSASWQNDLKIEKAKEWGCG